MLLGEEVGARAAWLPGFEAQAVAHAAGVIFQNLARGNAERQFPHARIFYAAGEAHHLGAGIFAFRQAFVPLDAVGEDRRHVRERFHIVDAGRLAPYARARREWRFGARVSATPFQRVDQRRLFAADVAARAGVHDQFEVKAGAENILAEETRFGRFCNGATQVDRRLDIFAAQEDIAAISLQGEGADQHALHQLVRHLLHQEAVFIGARLHLIGVAQQVTDVHGFIFRHQAPLQTRGEACAAAPFQAGIFHCRDNFVRRHAVQRFFRAGIAIFAAVFFEPDRLLVIAHAPGQRVRFRSTNDLFDGH